jgi:adenylate cyclase
VEESDGDLMGDGVNIVARLESAAAPERSAFPRMRQVKASLDLAVTDLGATQLENIAEPIRVYSLRVGLPAQPKPREPDAPVKPAPRTAISDARR